MHLGISNAKLGRKKHTQKLKHNTLAANLALNLRFGAIPNERSNRCTVRRTLAIFCRCFSTLIDIVSFRFFDVLIQTRSRLTMQQSRTLEVDMRHLDSVLLQYYGYALDRDPTPFHFDFRTSTTWTRQGLESVMRQISATEMT